MLQIGITLAQNLGDGTLGATLDVSSARVDLGEWGWEVDKELTKIAAEDLSLRLADVDGTIWAWLQTQIPCSAGLLPPWLVIDVDGTRAFTGLVDVDGLSHTAASGEISLQARSWESMLDKKYLGAARPEDDADPGKNPWLRPYPLAACDRVPSETRDVYFHVAGLLPFGITPLLVVGPPNNWLQLGDQVQLALLPGKTYKITALEGDKLASLAGLREDLYAYLRHHDLPKKTALTRLPRETESRVYYTIAKTVKGDDKKPVYALTLDTVDGIVPGDQLRQLASSKGSGWTVLQVDVAARAVITREEVRDVVLGDRVFFSEDSLQEQVYLDARLALERAAAPFGVDMTRYQPPTLPVPVFVWLPLRPLEGEDLLSVKDLDAGATTLRLYGGGSRVWDGTPETGWGPASGTLPRAHWTDQLATAPASLMPEESATLTPRAPRRYKAYDGRWRRWPLTVLVDGREEYDPNDPWDAGLAVLPDAAGVLVYDYTQMRRVQLTGTSAVLTPWDGSAWGAGQTVNLPGAAVLTACVMADVEARILALTTAGLRLYTLPAGTATEALAVPAAAAGAVLRSTPWGAYLVGRQGYGRVQLVDGALQLAWVDLVDQVSQLYPNTFCGLDAENLVVLGRFEAQDQDGKTVSETWALRLSPTPTTAQASVLWSERLLEGAPCTVGALRDPSCPGRVIGHCGGRLFQISRTLPLAYALERFKPSGMTAGELIEHIGQVLQAAIVATPDGALRVVSRSLAETPVDLSIPDYKVQTTRAWEHFYTCVRVSGENEDLYADVPGPGETGPEGGQLLEVSGHPLLWTLSGCEAMARALHAWFSVPRRLQEQTWVWADPNTAPPWESLPPLARVRLNGGSTVWLVLSLKDRKAKGEAAVQLLELP